MATTTPARPRWRWVRDRPVPAAVVGSVLVVAAGSVAQLVDYAVLDLRVDVLDSAEDGGAFGLVGDLAALAAAGSAWLLLVRSPHRRPALVALPPLLTVIAVDKALRVHDHVPHYLLLYAPVLAGAFACVVAVARMVPRPGSRLLLAGVALLAVAFGLHVVGERVLTGLGVGADPLAHQLKAVVKHGCEVQAWLLLAIGCVPAALHAHPRRSPHRGAVHPDDAPDAGRGP
ncbi:hypothetical protein ACI78Q_07635 [Geodermatophilus sp. SYSU D00705]